MAAAAKIDQEKRVVEVDRIKLIATLIENRDKHVKDYEEAMAGYRSSLLEKLDVAFDKAKNSLDAQYLKLKNKVSSFTEEDISKQSDYITLVDSITVEMKVPRSYAKEYDAAIDMAKWDINETLELTHAEFTCFVRDQWDWKSGFDAVSKMYNSKT